MRRALIEEPHHETDNSFLRIRDEGDKVTMTFKRRADPRGNTIDNGQEIEVIVSSFEDTIELLREAGWSYKTFQESRRETWRLGGVEVVIDEWPWLQPMIEIEGDSEEGVRAAADKLGFDWDEAVFGSCEVVYHRDYPNMTVRGSIDIKEARFSDPVPPEFGAHA